MHRFPNQTDSAYIGRWLWLYMKSLENWWPKLRGHLQHFSGACNAICYIESAKKKKKNASDPTFFQKDFCCLQHKKIKKVWRGLRSFEERLQSWHHGRIKEIRYNCSADRSAQHFIIAISSHCHIKRKQPQKIFLQYSCSVSKINIIKKYLWCKFCKVLYTKLPFFQKLTPYPHFFHLKSFL